MIRKEIHFYGQVQGVGFRYRAKYMASSIGITGWVRNEWDGSVTMEVQGSEIQINELLKQINASSYIMIRNMEYKELPLNENERGFHVR